MLSMTIKTTLAIGLMSVLVGGFASAGFAYKASESFQSKQSVSGSSGERNAEGSDFAVIREKKRYPIVIPPASQLRSLLRAQKAQRSAAGKREEPTEAAEQEKVIPPLGLLPVLSQPRCDRSIPTRRELLKMLKRNPADANQILRMCDMDVRSISPIRQLPVGSRQLPEDKRQRPVGTWGR